MNAPLAFSQTHVADPRPADLTIELPLETRNECNTRKHWRDRHGRSSVNRPAVSRAIVAELGGSGTDIVAAQTRALSKKNRPTGTAWDARRDSQAKLAEHLLPCVVITTRIAPKSIARHDGITSALKACVDGAADGLGIDDDDPRVEWRYAQEKGAPKTYAVRIEIRRLQSTITEATPRTATLPPSQSFSTARHRWSRAARRPSKDSTAR